MRHGIPCKKRRTQPLPKYLYISIGGSCVLLYTNARVITHYISMARTNITETWKSIQGISTTIRLGMGGVFCCHSHSPLPGAGTACLDLVFEYQLTMAAAHTIPPLVWTHEIVVVVIIVFLQCTRWMMRWRICLTAAKTWARQTPWKDSLRSIQGARAYVLLSPLVCIINSPGQMPAVPITYTCAKPHRRTAQCW